MYFNHCWLATPLSQAMHLSIFWGHPSRWRVHFIFNSANSDVRHSSTMSRVCPMVSFLTGSISKTFWFSRIPWAGYSVFLRFTQAEGKIIGVLLQPPWRRGALTWVCLARHHRGSQEMIVSPQARPTAPAGPRHSCGELTKKGIRPAALSLSRASCSAEARMANLPSEGMAFNLTPPIKPAFSTEECACKRAPG